MSSFFGFNASDKDDYYFISYNTEDVNRVSQICKILYKNGMHLWYDDGIPHNAYWESVLAEKIDNCKEAIFFITKNIFEKAKSRNINEVYTYKEYDLARRYKKKRLIVLLDEIKDSDVPYHLMSWWQEIDPKSIQGIVSYQDAPITVAEKVLSELDLKTVREHSIDDDISNPIFNAVINHPQYGDEREYVHIRQWGDVEWKRSIYLIPGKQYEVDILFRNDANPKYNSSDYNHSAVALNTRISIDLPRFVIDTRKSKLTVRIIYGVENKECVDFVELQMETGTGKPIRVVDGNERMINNWKANNLIIPSNLFSFEGALIGLNVLNGVIPGGDDYSGHVRFVFEVGQ